MTRARATLTGAAAIAIWAGLATLTTLTGRIPAFQLNAMTFAIGGTAGLIWLLATGRWRRLSGLRPGALAFGTAGLFGYHALYFLALRLAPPADAGLVAYLWPLLIVLMSGLLPGERLRPLQVLGAAAGFAGTAVLILGPRDADPGPMAMTGLALALCAALVWSGYSVLSRRMAHVPTEAVALSCLAAAALSAVLHLLLETTVTPAGAPQWAAVVALGLGPLGLAFFCWDIGMKRGNIQLLGTLSYAAPILSTLALILAGQARPTATLIMAAVLVAGGAALAALGGRTAR